MLQYATYQNKGVRLAVCCEVLLILEDVGRSVTSNIVFRDEATFHLPGEQQIPCPHAATAITYKGQAVLSSVYFLLYPDKCSVLFQRCYWCFVPKGGERIPHSHLIWEEGNPNDTLFWQNLTPQYRIITRLLERQLIGTGGPRPHET